MKIYLECLCKSWVTLDSSNRVQCKTGQGNGCSRVVIRVIEIPTTVNLPHCEASSMRVCVNAEIGSSRNTNEYYWHHPSPRYGKQDDTFVFQIRPCIKRLKINKNLQTIVINKIKKLQCDSLFVIRGQSSFPMPYVGHQWAICEGGQSAQKKKVIAWTRAKSLNT